MKRAHWIILVLLILTGYTAYRGIVGFQNLQFDQPEIILKANPGQNSLEPQNSHKCGPGDAPGCVQFDKGNLGTIAFQIQNVPEDTTCSETPKPQWVITEVKVTAAETAPGSEKGDYTKPIPNWLADAFPQSNSFTGVSYEVGLSYGTSSTVIIDLNNNVGRKLIYYTVTAKNCDGTETLVADLMVRNEGKTESAQFRKLVTYLRTG